MKSAGGQRRRVKQLVYLHFVFPPQSFSSTFVKQLVCFAVLALFEQVLHALCRWEVLAAGTSTLGTLLASWLLDLA